MPIFTYYRFHVRSFIAARSSLSDPLSLNPRDRCERNVLYLAEMEREISKCCYYALKTEMARDYNEERRKNNPRMYSGYSYV